MISDSNRPEDPTPEAGPGETTPPLLEVPHDEDDEVTEDEISPVEGLMNPEDGQNSPTSDADAPLPG